MLHVVTSVQETAGFFKAKKNALRIVRACGRPLRSAAGSRRSAGASERSRPEKAGILRSGVSPASPFCTRCFRHRKRNGLQERNRLLRRIPCEAGLHLRPAMRRRVPLFRVPLSGMARILCPGSKTAQTHGRNAPCAACVMRFLVHSASTEPSLAEAPRSACDNFFGILGKNKLFLQNYLAFCSCL